MFSPFYGKVFAVLVLLAMIGWLLMSPEERRRMEQERRERQREQKKPFYGCGVLLGMFFLFFGLLSVRAAYEVYFGTPAAPAPKAGTAAPTPETPPTPPPAPLVEGRPAHLRGSLPDGCTLLRREEVGASLSRSVVYDPFQLLYSRDTAVSCAYVDRPVPHPRRPSREVGFDVVRMPPASELSQWATPVPDAPEGVRWRKTDRGTSVSIPTDHGLQIRLWVALRDGKRTPKQRTAAELAVARDLVRPLQERARNLSPSAVEPGPVTGTRARPAWFLARPWDLNYEDGAPTERTWYTVLESLYALRARYGTRVKVIVRDEVSEPGELEPEEMARAVEGAFAVGRSDNSPRRDGALVVVDLATHQAWFFFGPSAPPLTLARGRPFPREWHGRDLTLRGPGLATRLKALTRAYAQAYARLGVDGPPELVTAPVP
jgi:hypothetical protein